MKLTLGLQVLGAQISSQNVVGNITTFDLTLDQEVTLTESFYPPFSPLDFITVSGGALGLWLGIGAVQVVQYVVNASSLFKFSTMG